MCGGYLYKGIEIPQARADPALVCGVFLSFSTYLLTLGTGFGTLELALEVVEC